MDLNRFRAIGFAATLSAVACCVPEPAAARGPAPCAATIVAVRRFPSGPAQYQSGTLRLGNGASLRLQGTSAELYQVKQMNVGDPVAACYGPLNVYADAGPSRSIVVVDLKNGAFYGTLLGTWKAR